MQFISFAHSKWIKNTRLNVCLAMLSKYEREWDFDAGWEHKLEIRLNSFNYDC